MAAETLWVGGINMSTFLNNQKSVLTVMLQCETPETAIARIRNAIPNGAEAFGLQLENFNLELRTKDNLLRIFREMKNKPCYITNYRSCNNKSKSDFQLAEELLAVAEYGGTLFDIMGDMFSRHEEELTDNADAIAKQIELINELHGMGKEVLMSSHLYKFAPAERVLEIAFEQKRRGADIIKIVTGADTMEQQIENLRITDLLKRELGKPFLFLSGGECSIHRRLGWKLGCSMILCVYEHDHLSTPPQPLLSIAKTIRDNLYF